VGLAVVLFLVGFGLLAVGILIGRYYVPDDRALKRTARHSRSYMRAINHLLGRDKDAAIAELRKIVEEDVSDIEPYFALGALFRSRGEWERAVRVHQAIELRPDTKKRTRLRSLYELGLDFRAAGMPRRATKAMEQCLSEDNKHEGALRALCGLYEEQHCYAEAADAWGRLSKLLTGETSPRESHLWAAAARQAIESGDLESAKRSLKRAERLDAQDAHVIATSAELAAAKGNPRGASKQLRRALVIAPDLAPYFAPARRERRRGR
jgi:lipopolysaccharide biosynthesis regulator YciM